MNPDRHEALRRLPPVDQILGAAPLSALLEREPRPVIVRHVRAHLDRLREGVLAGEIAAAAIGSAADVATAVAREVADRPRGPRRVLNATGIVLHTNLGRARLAGEAVDALLEAAVGACDLELDLETGKRSSRGDHVEGRLTELTGAEAALVVNNNAGALVLALNELAQDREAIVSRGELVEIGGSFRLPDVMARTGARLVEVGTTNRTHARDYEAAIGPDTAILLKVHRSNFRQDGFVGEPTLAELVAVGRRHDLPVLHDLGSGALHVLAAMRDEPRLGESLAADVDLVTMSGDKLLGGPQAGIILGKVPLVARLRANPLARALRVDKFTLAALAATLDLLEDADEARRRVPTLRALASPVAEVRSRAEALARGLATCAVLRAEVVAAESEVGGGAVPARGLPSAAVALTHDTLSAEDLAAALRRLAIPVIGRIVAERVLLDPRSLGPEEDAECVRVIAAGFGGKGGEG